MATKCFSFSRRFLLIQVLLLSSLATLAQEAKVIPVTGATGGAHDPSIAFEKGTWYVFTTGKTPDGGQFAIRCSSDLKTWRPCGEVFDAIPAWIQQRSPQTKDLWAPDISYEHGEYRLYYAYSVFGKNTSGIGLAVNRTLDRKDPAYGWQDRGLVFESRASDDYNAIDPNYIEDGRGKGWLVFGSFWSGIQLFEVGADGKPLEPRPRLYHLAGRARPVDAVPAASGLPPDWQAEEAPFLIHHGSYYYLFTSWDLCCRGVKSTYRTMVGRSHQVTGPYIDAAGKPLAEGGGTAVLVANGKWLGPGGESLVKQKDGGFLMVFHAYDAVTGQPFLQLSTVGWRDGWPVVALGN